MVLAAREVELWPRTVERVRNGRMDGRKVTEKNKGICWKCLDMARGLMYSGLVGIECMGSWCE